MCNPGEFNLRSSLKHHHNIPTCLCICVCMRACLPGYNCIKCKFNMLTIFFFCFILYNRFNVISLLSWNAINEGLPVSSTESQRQHIWGHFELFCQIEESSPYFLESCCAIPHARLCVPLHLIYKRSIEICMRPMMPALKIHPNREYIDSFVIELSLSFSCHHSRRSLSRLMYYQTHAAPLSLFLSATNKLRTLLTLLIALVF